MFCVAEKLQGEQGVIQQLFLSWNRNLYCPLIVVRIRGFKRKLKFLLRCMLNPLLPVSQRPSRSTALKKSSENKEDSAGHRFCSAVLNCLTHIGVMLFISAVGFKFTLKDINNTMELSFQTKYTIIFFHYGRAQFQNLSHPAILIPKVLGNKK